MIKRAIYQTLEDRDNPDYVEDNGPFMCDRGNAWLGMGFYFWESFIQNAHWWGTHENGYNNNYLICESSYVQNDEKCFNLVDNYEHLNMYNETIELMIQKGLYVTNTTTVARVIEFIKNTLGIFNYEAIRVYGVNCKSPTTIYSKTTIFNVKNKKAYFDSIPAIQVCFYSKNCLDMTGFKIVYPDTYIEGYLT